MFDVTLVCSALLSSVYRYFCVIHSLRNFSTEARLGFCTNCKAALGAKAVLHSIELNRTQLNPSAEDPVEADTLQKTSHRNPILAGAWRPTVFSFPHFTPFLAPPQS